MTESYIYFIFSKGHLTEDNPIKLILQDIRTPRSFRPSSEFAIETRSDEGYVIDGGGGDIVVQMTKMNSLTEMTLSVDDL